jgi:uncharacterized protein (DUF885 family)
MRRLSRALIVFTALAFFALAGVEAARAQTTDESARLNQWFAERWKEQLARSPIQKTFLGIKDADYDKIDDLSEAATDRQLAWLRSATAEMKKTFVYERLSPEARTSYDLWVYGLEQAERSVPFRRHGYVFTQMQGPQASLPQILIAFHRVDSPADMTAYVARIGGLARAFDQLLLRAQAAAKDGIRPPRFAYEGVIAQTRGLVKGAPFGGEGDAPIWADAKTEVDGLLKAGKVTEAEADKLRTAAREALTATFKPSVDAIVAWFEQDMKNTGAEPHGAGALPNGAAFYKVQLEASTTTNMTADEIHQLGLSEVARLHAEMEAVKTQVGFKGTLKEFFTFMREDPQFFYPNTDEGREGYLQAARDHLAFIKTKLPHYFGILPKADLQVKRVEPFREQPGAAQHYNPGTPDGSRAGVYYAHLLDMKAMPKHQLEVVAYHEGNPGHQMQISIAQELQGLPTFRTQAGVTAYNEGWGLYAEKLAKEMGAYKDPYSEFGRLSSELWRAIRLVVDSGVHAKGWSEQRAVDYFTANSPSAEGAIRSEVKRYIVWPGQATAYKVGMQKILQLRARAERALGAKFDIRGFHDTVLGGGALPLTLLERRVDAWIASPK